MLARRKNEALSLMVVVMSPELNQGKIVNNFLLIMVDHDFFMQ